MIAVRTDTPDRQSGAPIHYAAGGVTYCGRRVPAGWQEVEVEHERMVCRHCLRRTP